MSDALLRCRGLARTHGRGATATVALAPTDCELWAGDRIALTGPSGSGKSTLLYLMAGLDTPTAGVISWPAIGERDTLRPLRVAMIFQGPSLLAPLTVVENVALPLMLGGSDEQEAHRRAHLALNELELGELAAKLPEEISGGQAQRVAIARAVAGTPQLILADEPTGQLDVVSGAAVIEVLLRASQRSGTALVVSTHDEAVANTLPGRWEMHNGELSICTGAVA